LSECRVEGEAAIEASLKVSPVVELTPHDDGTGAEDFCQMRTQACDGLGGTPIENVGEINKVVLAKI
jgi:hypothetical protein